MRGKKIKWIQTKKYNLAELTKKYFSYRVLNWLGLNDCGESF